ncbi:hypothetical protein NUACC26_010530 [Scytonema sp. NUACC26]
MLNFKTSGAHFKDYVRHNMKIAIASLAKVYLHQALKLNSKQPLALKYALRIKFQLE